MRKKRKSNKKLNIDNAHHIIDKAELPLGAITNMPHFEMNGNREIIIEGSKGVLEYDENIIRVNTGKTISQFMGRNLSIKCLSTESLIITGFVTSIEFIT